MHTFPTQMVGSFCQAPAGWCKLPSRSWNVLLLQADKAKSIWTNPIPSPDQLLSPFFFFLLQGALGKKNSVSLSEEISSETLIWGLLDFEQVKDFKVQLWHFWTFWINGSLIFCFVFLNPDYENNASMLHKLKRILKRLELCFKKKRHFYIVFLPHIYSSQTAQCKTNLHTWLSTRKFYPNLFYIYIF